MTTENEPQKSPSARDQVKQRLLDMGILTEITPPLPPQAIPRNRRPIPIEGKPVSEMIIEERR